MKLRYFPLETLFVNELFWFIKAFLHNRSSFCAVNEVISTPEGGVYIVSGKVYIAGSAGHPLVSDNFERLCSKETSERINETDISIKYVGVIKYHELCLVLFS